MNPFQTMEELTDKCILALFSFLPPKEVLKCARVCRRWKKLTEAPELWKMLSFRPGYENGLMVSGDGRGFIIIIIIIIIMIERNCKSENVGILFCNSLHLFISNMFNISNHLSLNANILKQFIPKLL